jgi:hypothetical protein
VDEVIPDGAIAAWNRLSEQPGSRTAGKSVKPGDEIHVPTAIPPGGGGGRATVMVSRTRVAAAQSHPLPRDSGSSEQNSDEDGDDGTNAMSSQSSSSTSSSDGSEQRSDGHSDGSGVEAPIFAADVEDVSAPDRSGVASSSSGAAAADVSAPDRSGVASSSSGAAAADVSAPDRVGRLLPSTMFWGPGRITQVKAKGSGQHVGYEATCYLQHHKQYRCTRRRNFGAGRAGRTMDLVERMLKFWLLSGNDPGCLTANDHTDHECVPDESEIPSLEELEAMCAAHDWSDVQMNRNKRHKS